MVYKRIRIKTPYGWQKCYVNDRIGLWKRYKEFVNNVIAFFMCINPRMKQRKDGRIKN